MDDAVQRFLAVVKPSEIRERLSTSAADYVIWSSLLALAEEAGNDHESHGCDSDESEASQ